jgi:hypothetical protein
MTKGLLFISVALILAPPVLASEAPAAAPKTAKPVKDRMICRTDVQIGSRVRGKRICRTQSEWKAAERQNGESVREMQRTSQAPPNG